MIRGDFHAGSVVMTPQIYDVIVLGGGPAGAAAGSQLADAGWRVLVVERSRYQACRIGETLPPRARIPLARLGVLDRMHDGGHLHAPAMVSVWGDSTPRWNDFITNPHGHGWHIDRARFDRMLAEECRARGALVLEGVKAGHCTHGNGGWRVSLHAGRRQADEHVFCRFLVDAAGRGPRKIRHCTLPVAYDQLVGISVLYSDCRDGENDDSTLIEAVSHGWWYSARLPDERCLAVFMTDADLVHGGRGGLKAFLQRQLRDAPFTSERVRPVADAKSIAAWSAVTSMNTSLCGADWLLAGDAAMTRDPLSGEGICQALESGIEAARAIDSALRGNVAAIMEYGRGVRAQFDDYLKSHAHYYFAEQRWRDFPFWCRRHGLLERAPRGRAVRMEQPAYQAMA
jgi:flavin-dependent dehydrogenase